MNPFETMILEAAVLEDDPVGKGCLQLPPIPGRNKRRYFNSESLRQNYKFKVRNTSELRFNFGQGCATQFQSQDGAARSEQFLRQSSLVPQFSDLRADNILRPFLSSFCHAPELELDNIESGALNCSVFGATCRNATGQKFRSQGGVGSKELRMSVP